MTDEEIVAALAEVLAQHRPRGRHFCGCGWEGDDMAVHLQDALLPTVRRVAEQRAAEELESAAAEFHAAMWRGAARDLRDRAAALTATPQPRNGHDDVSEYEGDYQCFGCGLTAYDLPDGVDPELMFDPDEHGIMYCQGCQQIPAGHRLADWAS